jgi:hypothetical protein
VTSAIHLVASSDDYLLEEAVDATVREVSGEFGNVEPEVLSDEITPENLSVELCSPSLFAPQRILVVPEVGSWLEASRRKSDSDQVDVQPLVRVLGDGMAEGIALVMGAVCRSKPKGALIDAVDKVGEFRWRPAPEAPKPWEDAVLSREQEAVLGKLLDKTAGEVRFTPQAKRLLLERLGFAPRLLHQEVMKLAAANVEGEVDEDLVLALSFPRERSLDVVWDALYERRAAPILDIMAATESGIRVVDRQGRAVTGEGAPYVLFGQISSILQNLLYLRQVAARNGLLEEMEPTRTRDTYWYPKIFKNSLGPKLIELIKEDAPSPLQRRGGRAPTLFSLGKQVKGAGRYPDDDLVEALAQLGPVENALRGDMAREALSVWLTSFLH